MKAALENPVAGANQHSHHSADLRQADLFDAGQRRDDGAAAAVNAVHTTWRVGAEAALKRLIYSGRPFTADDLHELVPEPPGHHNAVGGLFIGAARRGEIEAVGYRQSDRPEAHRRPVRVWRGTGGG